jgi:hypothetical protein
MLRHTAVLLLLTSTLHGQHVFYNQKQDQTAQDAVSAAKQITSGAVFNTMVSNLDLQARQETDTVLAYTREVLRATLVSVEVWGPSDKVPDDNIAGVKICRSLRCKLDTLEATIKKGSVLDSPGDQTTVEDRLKAISAKSAELHTAIKNLQAAAKTKDPAVIELLSHLGDAKDIVGYAKSIGTLTANQGLGKSLDELGSGLDQAIALYNSVKSIWDGYKAITVDPTSLRPAREEIELQLLRLEEQHIKNLARIRAVAHLEAGDVLGRISNARQFLGTQLDSPAKIDETLRAAAVSSFDRGKLNFMLLGLLEAAAAAASNDSIGRLELTREGQEERRYSIRRSAVNSSTYDQTIQAAVQRLAIYYKGGIKTSDLAALVFYISNSVAVPTIAAK